MTNSMRRTLAGVLLACMGLGGCGPGTTGEIGDTVTLDAGRIAGAGVSDSGVRVFRGIPFAAPPVGDNRWRPPQPVEPWDGVRDASSFGNVCMQSDGARWTNIAVMEGQPPTSEDCLYLNVWTPAETTNDALPVMVWFYGGAFTDGAGSAPLYDGTALAEKGAVIVTMNYRLGPFGFFAHPALTAESGHASSSNYGFMDMLASLEWVQRNISAFGGDPGNVTIFGQSAGALSVVMLMTSPRAEGLFHRAISQSLVGGGAMPGMTTLATAEARGLELAQAAGVSNVAELRAMTAGEVTAALGRPMYVVDNWAFPEDPAIVFADGRQHPVDAMFGSNKDDSLFARPTTAAQFEEQARRRYGELADRYLALYPHATDEEASASSVQAGKDQTFWGSRAIAEYQRRQGRNAYVFLFTQNPPGRDGEELPAAHASEVPYVFNNLGEHPLYPDPSIPEISAASAPDRALADRMSSYWVNFARTGDPNGPGLPNWPRHMGPDTVAAAILDAEPESERLPSVDRMLFFDRVLEAALEDL